MCKFLLTPLILTFVQVLVVAEVGQAALLLPDYLQPGKGDLLVFMAARTERIADLITPVGALPVLELPFTSTVFETEWFTSLLTSSRGTKGVAFIEPSIWPLDGLMLSICSTGTSGDVLQTAIGTTDSLASPLLCDTWTNSLLEEWILGSDSPGSFEPLAGPGTEIYSPNDFGVAAPSPLFVRDLDTGSHDGFWSPRYPDVHAGWNRVGQNVMTFED